MRTPFVTKECVYPGCDNSRRTRGLCHGHYQTMRAYVRAGRASERDLEARGLLLAKGPGGGSPVLDSTAFLRGSTVRGDPPARAADHADGTAVRTSDGYVLRKRGDEWTDGDLSFSDRDIDRMLAEGELEVGS